MFKLGDLVEPNSDILCVLVGAFPTCVTALNPGAVGIIVDIDRRTKPLSYHVMIDGGQRVVVIHSKFMRKIK